ncbi:uncharacterized peroxidase-related enzyme [Allomeiothermus silvanus DSM 9946]|uniref:Uncharacterized peroxidase-related enzyme n=1 Tax=Allomeiothermus silvanus (strain ATCC 700542 / DSM 9946 / NBRC 106475 / NCIMB 13440 / VI-R2) TaxID=526227 RepID=D7BCP3_ALLS1|nr:peroxidase-related enzyme [Allomeiothermus silvanus]ADH62928.1 uncharacterized peroxidase-related enzyme [Allomeiothermus silvanus DSM 9946]
MAFIGTFPVNQATGEVRAMYERAQANLGYVPNYAKVFSLRPEVMGAWSGLLASIRGHMDLRRYELVTLATARALHSSYCMLAHGTILRRQFYGPEQLAAIAGGTADAGLEPAEAAMMAFAERVAKDASSITASDVEGLRAHGFTDAEIFDIAAAAAARCFFSKLLDALGAEPDSVYLELEDDLRRRLTPGRPVSAAPVERVPEVPAAGEG